MLKCAKTNSRVTHENDFAHKTTYIPFYFLVFFKLIWSTRVLSIRLLKIISTKKVTVELAEAMRWWWCLVTQSVLLKKIRCRVEILDGDIMFLF